MLRSPFMPDEFNWIQVADLHFGQTNQPQVWPNVREAFLEDLRKLHERCGPWHLVIFTGDLASTGETDEFKKVEEEVLRRIFDELKSLGSGDAKLVAVPGNHDLQRPNVDRPSAALRQLLRDGGFQEIAEEFWAEGNGEYAQIVTAAFENYRKWWNATISSRVGYQRGNPAWRFCGYIRRWRASNRYCRVKRNVPPTDIWEL